MGDNNSWLFLKKFLTQGTKIASLAPSSRWLSRRVLTGVDWGSAKVILELGAGTGAMTEELLKKASIDARVILIERDRDFVQVLKKRFSRDSRVLIVEGDVAELVTILKNAGLTSVDCVISGLPIPSFESWQQKKFFSELSKILPNGAFNQITEIPLLYWSIYRRYFKTVRFIFEPRNIPPAGVYLCRGIRSESTSVSQ